MWPININNSLAPYLILPCAFLSLARSFRRSSFQRRRCGYAWFQLNTDTGFGSVFSSFSPFLFVSFQFKFSFHLCELICKRETNATISATAHLSCNCCDFLRTVLLMVSRWHRAEIGDTWIWTCWSVAVDRLKWWLWQQVGRLVEIIVQ